MTYFVGIDIAKHHHHAMIINHLKEVIVETFSFDNSQAGFQCLKQTLGSLGDSSQIKIGFESTGHYGANLKHFLVNLNFDFMEINPILIKRFIQASSLRKTKSDAIDSRSICEYLSNVEFNSYWTTSYHTQTLKSLTRARDTLIKQRSLMLQSMTNVLDQYFPEFKPFFNDSLKSSTALYILSNYPSKDKIASMNIHSYQKMKSQLRRTISYAKFQTLRTLAKTSIGCSDDSFECILSSYLSIYKEIDNQIISLEKEIESHYLQTHCHIHTIPGISIMSAAGIISEIDNINKFSKADKIVAYAGLDPAYYQSGESEFLGRMVKRGSSYLRQYLMNVSITCIVHIPTLYDFYQKKRKEGKCHRVALSHVSKKLIRIIYKLESCQISFDTNQLQ